MNDELRQKQAEAVLVLLHKVMSEYEASLATIEANDLVKAFNSLCESAEVQAEPERAVGAMAMLFEVIATTNKDNTEFLEKMHAVMSLS